MDIGLAIMGRGLGFEGSGELLRLNLPAGIDMRAARVEARGLANEHLEPKLDVHDRPAVPQRANLGQNYPNPFNPLTTISYELADSRSVELTIFNLEGRRIITLVHEEQPAGRHQVTWDGRDTLGRRVASGSYFYRLEAGNYVRTNRMTLLK